MLEYIQSLRLVDDANRFLLSANYMTLWNYVKRPIHSLIDYYTAVQVYFQNGAKLPEEWQNCVSHALKEQYGNNIIDEALMSVSRVDLSTFFFFFWH